MYISSIQRAQLIALIPSNVIVVKEPRGGQQQLQILSKVLGRWRVNIRRSREYIVESQVSRLIILLIQNLTCSFRSFVAIERIEWYAKFLVRLVVIPSVVQGSQIARIQCFFRLATLRSSRITLFLLFYILYCVI